VVTTDRDGHTYGWIVIPQARVKKHNSGKLATHIIKLVAKNTERADPMGPRSRTS